MTPTPQHPPRRPPTPRPSVAFNLAPKQAPKKPEKPEGFDEDLDRACKEFLKNNIPVSNIVFVEEFAKYLPLFNKEMHKTLDPKAKTQLTQEYFGRFSPQHNIYILTHELDASGVKHPTDGKKYKIECTLPPTFRRVVSLNDVGKKVPSLITAFFNATTNSSGPFDQRKKLYAQQIAEAIGLGDKKLGHSAADHAAFAKMEADLLGGKKPSAPAEETQRTAPDKPSAGGLSIEW